MLPTILVKVAGVTAIEASGEDVIAAEPDIFPEVAVTVTEPAVTAVATPFDPSVVPTETTAILDEPHATDVVRS